MLKFCLLKTVYFYNYDFLKNVQQCLTFGGLDKYLHPKSGLMREKLLLREVTKWRNYDNMNFEKLDVRIY